jgi:hypothetical protein
LELAGLEAVGFEGCVVFLVVVGGEGGAEGFDGEREVVEGEEASAPGDGGLEVVEARGDVGKGHPEGEGFEGGVVDVGNIAHGEGRVREVVEDLVGVFGIEHVGPLPVQGAFTDLRAWRGGVEGGSEFLSVIYGEKYFLEFWRGPAELRAVVRTEVARGGEVD